jgi:predicted oxidoreductase
VPIDEGPYYCVKLWPGGPNTTGGPRRDSQGRVISVRGEPIPGLFAAGELGQVSGLLYPADGANLCEAFCYGQIAAETALSRFRNV